LLKNSSKRESSIHKDISQNNILITKKEERVKSSYGSKRGSDYSKYQLYIQGTQNKDIDPKSLIMQSVYSRDYQAKPPRPVAAAKPMHSNLFSSLIASMTDPTPEQQTHSLS
jgi:hypothetical protein